MRKMREQILWTSALFACLSLGGASIAISQNGSGHLRSVQSSASLRPDLSLPSTGQDGRCFPGTGL